MSDPKVTVHAVVTVTVEIHNNGAWGPDCTMGQVHKQAAESALGVLRNLGNPAVAAGLSHRLRVVGEPTVKAVSVEEQR